MSNIKMLSVNEVAKLFGVNPMTIYRKANKGELPAIKFGKKWLFPEDVLQKWINDNLTNIKGGSTKKHLDCPIKSSNDNNMTIETTFLKALKQIKELKLLYIFGSFERKLDTPLSDIDFAYLDDETISSYDLEPKIEDTIFNNFQKNKRIDLVQLIKAPIAIQYKAIKEGRLIYSANEKTRSDFEEKVINHYLDYESVLNLFYHTSYKEVA